MNYFVIIKRYLRSIFLHPWLFEGTVLRVSKVGCMSHPSPRHPPLPTSMSTKFMISTQLVDCCSRFALVSATLCMPNYLCDLTVSLDSFRPDAVLRGGQGETGCKIARLHRPNTCIYSVASHSWCHTIHSIMYYVIKNSCPPNTDLATPLATPRCCS